MIDLEAAQAKFAVAFAAMKPNEFVVALLQLRGDNLISRDEFRTLLPFKLDIPEETESADE